jgi:membrane protease YdiL (CAAX protease family)
MLEQVPLRKLLLDRDDRIHIGWRAVGFYVAYLSASFLVTVPIVVVAMLFRKGDHVPDPRFNHLFPCLGALAATWLCLSMERCPFTSVWYRFNRTWFKEFAFGILGGALVMGATATLALSLGGFRWVPNFKGAGLEPLLGIVLYLVVAIHEETAFRGYPFQRLVSGIGLWPAQILLALVFAAFHWNNPGMAGATKLYLVLAGILLGQCYLKTRSLALPIGLHLGWNWTQGNLMGFGVSGLQSKGLLTPILHNKPQWITGGSFGLEASFPCTIVCLALIGALLL